MQWKALHFAVFLSASLVVLQGQAASQLAPEHFGVTNGIPVPTVAGAPFTATAVIELQYDTADEDTVVLRTINLLARDSKGRTRKETRRLMPESFHGSPQLLAVRIYDPQTHLYTICDPVLHIARRQIVPEPAKAESKPNPLIRNEDLGTSTMDGLSVKGTRVTRTLPAKVSGTGSPAEIELEEWFSEDLHLDLLVRYSDSRVGTQTIGISNLKRDEPPASTFEVPAGYKILDVAPSAAPEATAKDATSAPLTP